MSDPFAAPATFAALDLPVRATVARFGAALGLVAQVRVAVTGLGEPAPLVVALVGLAAAVALTASAGARAAIGVACLVGVAMAALGVPGSCLATDLCVSAAAGLALQAAGHERWATALAVTVALTAMADVVLVVGMAGPAVAAVWLTTRVVSAAGLVRLLGR